MSEREANGSATASGRTPREATARAQGFLAYLGAAPVGDLRGRLAEKSKRIARRLRRVPGLGYSGRPIPLTYRVGGTNLLAADDEFGSWVGAPSMEYDPETDTLYLHVRHRSSAARGYEVAIYELCRDTLRLEELLSVRKENFGARSVEGGDLVVEDGEFRWFVSYQHDDHGDWRIEQRRARTVDGLRESGQDLPIVSSYYHTKDPTVVDGELYLASHSRTWLQSGVERVDVDAELPIASELTVDGAGHARITTDGVLGTEVFVDLWPTLPGTQLSNVLWTADERATSGSLGTTAVHVAPSTYFVSGCGRSVTYVDVEQAGDTVFLVWQEEKPDGSNDLVGTSVSVDTYRDLL